MQSEGNADTDWGNTSFIQEKKEENGVDEICLDNVGVPRLKRLFSVTWNLGTKQNILCSNRMQTIQTPMKACDKNQYCDQSKGFKSNNADSCWFPKQRQNLFTLSQIVERFGVC